MADTSFTARVTTIAAVWLNQLNKWAFWGRRPNYATTTGAANAQILTLESGSLYAAGSEADGDVFIFAAGFTNTGAATLQIKTPTGTNTARAIQQNGLPLVGGEVQAGLIYQVARLGTTWQLTNLSKVYGAIEPVGAVAGTNTITGAVSAANQGYGLNAHYTLIPANTNTGATTLNLTPTGGVALGAKNIFWNGAALTGGELRQNCPVILEYDGTQFNLVGNSSAIPVGLINAKGDLLAGTAADAIARLAVGTDGQALSADSSQTTGLVYIDNPSRPNLLINSNWQIDQINEGALYTVGASTQGPDGWTGALVGTGVFKLRTLADPDNAALKCLEITCTTADAAIAAGDLYVIQTTVEGYDAASLMAGTASAQAITIQFKFKSNVNGVYGIRVANSAANRSYVGIFTVADASEHEYTLTLTLDTTGTWLYTNGVGLDIRITLAGGSNFQTTAGSWQAGNFFTTSAQCNFMSANTNVAYLKRIQLIPGALVQAYKAADINKELAKAQRYYWKTYEQGTAIASATTTGQWRGSSDGGSNIFSNVGYAPMRASPTGTTYSPVTGTAARFRNETTGADVVAAVNIASATQLAASATFAAASQIGGGHFTANARLS